MMWQAGTGQDSARFAGGVAFDLTSSLIGAGGQLVSGLLGSNAASSAADTQSAAANRAADMAMTQYGQTRQDLAPYRDYGVTAGNKLTARLDSLTSPFNPTQEQLAQTPGYQFALSQGLQGVQNSAAARGLGISGAALKGAAQFATGLADNTYKTQFDIDQANKGNAFNRLLALTQVGQNAANQTGTLGQQAATTAGNMTTAGANAQASGTVGGTNAITGGLNNALGQYQAYRYLQGGY